MHVAVLTYQVPHRKTYDSLCLLKSFGYDDVSVFATPLSYKKNYSPLVAHRPDMFYMVPQTGDVCNAFGYSYSKIDDYGEADISSDVPVLVCGSGLLPDEFVSAHILINAHPGYIPYARGLDAMKWALYEGYPIGVTSHLIGDQVDAGVVLERRLVEVLQSDTVLELGLRVYQVEINMLVNALSLLYKGHTFLAADPQYPVHKRMPKEIEIAMMERFENLKSEIARGHGICKCGWPLNGQAKCLHCEMRFMS